MSLEIRKLTVQDSNQLSDLCLNEDTRYTKFFVPFDFRPSSIYEILNNLIKDCFFGIFLNDQMVGFFMLRGWDEGYETPSYGVLISKAFSGMGLAKLTLQHSISFCRIKSVGRLMLKVHPDNVVAKKLYEDFGFLQAGYDPSNKNLLYFKDLT